MAPKKIICRQYSSEFLQYGFIPSSSNKTKPLCLVCKSEMSNSSMKADKLKLHLQSKHPHLASKPLDFFKGLREKFYKRSTISGFVSKCKGKKEKGIIVSFKISKLIAVNLKPHTLGENLILPSIKLAKSEMLGEEAASITQHIPLSKQTVSRRIDDMANNVELQLISHLQKTQFALQVDETTLKNGKALLMTYVRFLDDANQMRNEMLFALNLKSDCKGKSIYDVVTTYLADNDIPLTNIIACATDGAGAMIGRYKGFIGLLKADLPSVYTIHCMVHRQHLAAKNLGGRLHDSLKVVINSINFVRGSAHRDRLFQLLCGDNEDDYHRLLLHTEVRWLSKGQCFKRFTDLWDTILEFFEGEPLREDIIKSKLDIFYLSDMFEKLNMVNKQLQGRESNLITCKEAINAFLKKLNLYKVNMRRQKLGHFPALEPLQDQLVDDDYEIFCNHLDKLSEEMVSRFKDVIEMEVPDWVVLPFEVDPADVKESLQEELIELQCNESAKGRFRQGLQLFWTSPEVITRFPGLWKEVKLLFIAFPTSYLVEVGFSKVVHLLTRSRNRLQIDRRGDLRMSLTSFVPDLEKLVREVME